MTQTKNPSDSVSLDEWGKRLVALRTQHGSEGDKWLQLLYTSYLQRFLSDNSRIWTTGQWMISLSLAPLVAIPSLPKQNLPFNILFLAIPSVSLIWIWLIIAENHRAFQDKSLEWLSAIEKVLGVEKPGGAKVANGLLLIKPGFIRKMRWVLAWGISVVWIAIIVGTLWLSQSSGHQNQPEPSQQNQKK